MNITRVIALIAIAAALHFGYNFAAPIMDPVWAAFSSTQWPQTQGNIVRTAVEKGHKGRPYALVEYAYVVGGKTYQSSRVSFMNLDGDPASEPELAARYPVEKPVDVFFNPEAPEESVLRPGLHSILPVALLALLLLVLVGFISSVVRVFLRAQPAPSAE